MLSLKIFGPSYSVIRYLVTTTKYLAITITIGPFYVVVFVVAVFTFGSKEIPRCMEVTLSKTYLSYRNYEISPSFKLVNAS